MSALKQVIAALGDTSVFGLGNDIPLFRQALAEIDNRLTALESAEKADRANHQPTTETK
jgi:hypothetical protein